MVTWLNNARIVSIFAVVLLHVADIILVENGIGTEYWWAGNVFSTLVRWCVPVLVMISGALLLDARKQESLAKFYSKRLSKILIPMLFWAIFFSFWTFLHGFVDGAPPTYFTLLNNLVRGLPYEHLWFLYMISGLYLFAPFLRIIFEHLEKKEIELLVISAFSIASINFIYMSFHGSGGPILFFNWFLLYLPFFLIGDLIRRDNSKRRIFPLITFALSSLLTFVGYYFVSAQNELIGQAYFHGYLSMTVIPMSISMMYLLKLWNKPILNEHLGKQLSSLSFGIYLIHPIILEIFNQTGYMKTVHPVISIPSATAVIFAVSFAVAWMFYKTPYLKRVI
ncbi:MAG: acyltransferase [Ekhidna sp.]